MKFLPLPKPPEIPIEEKQIHALFGFKIENGVPVDIPMDRMLAIRNLLTFQEMRRYFYENR